LLLQVLRGCYGFARTVLTYAKPQRGVVIAF